LRAKVALVTGGSIGIGAAVVTALLARGTDVAFTYLRHQPDELVSTLHGRGPRVLAWQLDATDAAAVDQVVDMVVETLGQPIDILVNNTGGLVVRQEVAGMSDETWRQVVDLNLTSAFYVTRSVLRHMGPAGRIVNIGSLAGENGGGRGAVAYASAKAALHGFTRALAKELGPRQITVNAVAPGFILDTPFHETHSTPADMTSSVLASPLKRAGTTADVANVVAFLASDDAAFCTGVVVDANGGSYFA
jgi:3-oxoacyl-[acyl-carrier protein] reductase